MDIRAAKEKIEKGQWKNEIPPELRQKAKKIDSKPAKAKLKNPFRKKKP